MEKVTIKKVPLKLRDVGNLKKILEAELEKCRDIQIYIENSLYKEIRYNFFDYDMNPGFEEDEQHYSKAIQNVYEFVNSKNGRTEGIIDFIANSSDYMQITKFSYGKIQYSHYLCRMRKVIVIYEDNEN